jgi:hypothetical protein
VRCAGATPPAHRVCACLLATVAALTLAAAVSRAQGTHRPMAQAAAADSARGAVAAPAASDSAADPFAEFTPPAAPRFT